MPKPTRDEQDTSLRAFVLAKTAAWRLLLNSGTLLRAAAPRLRTLMPEDMVETLEIAVAQSRYTEGHRARILDKICARLAILPHATELLRTIADEPIPIPLRDWTDPARDDQYARRLRVAVDNAVDHQRACVRSNLRLVFSQAARFFRNQAIPFDDMIAEGNVGLMIAVDRFDPSRGVQFSTYAIYWIRHLITRSFDQHGRTVRVPVNARILAGQIRRVREQAERIGMVLTDAEVAEATGVSLERLRQVDRDIQFPLRFDTVTGRAGRGRHHDDDWPDAIEVAGDSVDPVEELEEAEDVELIHEALRELPPKFAMILRQRFGFDGHDPQTLQEIGERMNLSRERIRQHQNRALDELGEHLNRARSRARARTTSP